jgi:phage shock protein PspC (stress-responsive transcriptional regulator)
MLFLVMEIHVGVLIRVTVKILFTMKRSRTDKVIAGVCGGIGKHTGINPWLFRILFIILGGGFWIYLLMWIFVEEENF